MSIYARQINPAYQESPLSWSDMFPDNLVLDGNRHYTSHTIPAYDQIRDSFDDMANTWELDSHSTLGELLRDYGFAREDGKPWSTQQKHAWRVLMESPEGAEDDGIMCHALQLLTGHRWDSSCLRGCCQGDWQTVYYDADTWTSEALSAFETEYFNTGSEWIIHDEEQPPESPEDISGYSVYCTAWNDDGIRKELAEAAGVKPKDVIMYAWDGEHTVDQYKEVV